MCGPDAIVGCVTSNESSTLTQRSWMPWLWQRDQTHWCWGPLQRPAGIQPLDLTVNGSANHFITYYRTAVKQKLDSGTDLQDVEIDFKLTTIKPLRSCWSACTTFLLLKQHFLMRQVKIKVKKMGSRMRTMNTGVIPTSFDPRQIFHSTLHVWS